MWHYEHVTKYINGPDLELVISETLQPRSYAWRLWRANTRGTHKDLTWANRATRQRFQRATEARRGGGLADARRRPC